MKMQWRPGGLSSCKLRSLNMLRFSASDGTDGPSMGSDLLTTMYASGLGARVCLTQFPTFFDFGANRRL